jgi:hypothetical protein
MRYASLSQLRSSGFASRTVNNAYPMWSTIQLRMWEYTPPFAKATTTDVSKWGGTSYRTVQRWGWWYATKKFAMKLIP